MKVYRDFWSVPVADVPAKTGAADVMDCSDILDVLGETGLRLGDKAVLDVGCGTGRVAQLCGAWTGVDVSPAAVAYCREHGLDAEIIEAPIELLTRYSTPWAGAAFDVTVCLSVFTHISRDDRRAYLSVFRRITKQLLVDILPGDEGGSIGAWRADPDVFAADVREHDFEIVCAYRRTSSDGYDHLYFLCQ